MTEPSWQYTDATHTIVFRVWDDGRMESCLVTVPEVQEWLSYGNTILQEPV